jgi:serine/threonine-protein kinase RsbW
MDLSPARLIVPVTRRAGLTVAAAIEAIGRLYYVAEMISDDGAFQDVHLEIHSTIEALDRVQEVAESVTRLLGFDEETVHWTAMAVRESVINAITHGNQSDPAKLVFIDFSATPASQPADLVVRVRDQGKGFDPRLLDNPLEPENILKASGRGIFLIRQFMDDVSVEPAHEGGMEVRMRKHLPKR